MTNKKDTNEHDNTDKRGFASMPHEKVVEIASKGGQASAKGNHASDEKAGHKDMAKKGSKEEHVKKTGEKK